MSIFVETGTATASPFIKKTITVTITVPDGFTYLQHNPTITDTGSVICLGNSEMFII